MSGPYKGRHKLQRLQQAQSDRPVEEVVKELRQQQAHVPNYREQSLKIHGLICAKCGREFDESNKQLLTVHHKDGNHNNNPSNGSNWENLCIYCHDDEHSRGILGDYLRS